jgi:hypothetical protein
LVTGSAGFFAAVIATLQSFAWAWIALGVLVVAIIILTAVRARHSTWIRSPEEISALPRLAATPDRAEKVA